MPSVKPRYGNNAKNQRQARFRDDKRKAGFCEVIVWVPVKWKDAIKVFAQQLRDGTNPDLAFEQAFPLNGDD